MKRRSTLQLRRGIRTGLRGTCSLLALLAAQMAGPGAAAQDQAPSETPSRPLFELQEIVVTARRQSEDLQKTPVAVSAFDADHLYQNQVQNLGDLQSHVPNLSLHVGDASNAVIYLRGVGQIDSISFNDPGVGVYLDDVYLGRAQGSFLDVLDPAQIEVLRGPQGTLYGRNTIGGAVKFTSVRPSNEVEGYADVTIGKYDRRDFKASISGPIVRDVLMAKVAFATLNRDGYTKNLFDGKDDNDKETIAWRGSLLFNPKEDLSFYFVVDGSRDTPSRSRSPHRETPIFSVVSGAFVPVISDPFVVDVNFNDRNKLTTWGVALTAEYEVGRMTLKSISAYREMRFRTHVDLDGTRDSSFGIYDFEDQNQFSQEVQLLYNADSWSLVAGLYYFREKDLTFGGAVAPNFFVPIPGFGFFPFPIVNAGERDQKNTSKAVFAQLDYDVTQDVGLTLGLRYTREKKVVASRGEEFFGTGITTAEEMRQVFGMGVGFSPTGFTASESWGSLSPKISLDYQATEDVLLYVSASRGFKSGGFNGRLTDRAQPFDPERLWSYEAGLKSTLADNRVRVNMAAFYNDYKDFQLSRFSIDPDTGGFLSLFENAGKATIYGAELEMTALVSQGLTVNFNLGYLEGRYDEFVGDFGIDVSDRRKLVNAPKWDGRAGFTYDHELGSLGTLSLSSAISFRSKTYLTVSSSEVLAQDPYSLVDASLSYTSPDERWTVIVSGQNLTDKAYREHGFDLSASPGVELGYYGAPRTYGVNLRVRL